MAGNGKGKQIAGKAPASSPSTSSGKRKKPVSRAQDGRDRRRKKRSGVLQFFDDAAQDADYDDEEVDNGDEDDLDFDDDDLDLDFSKESIPEGKEFKGAGKSYYHPFFVKEEELSGDELEELIKDRYGRGSEYVVYDDDPKERDDGVSVEHSAEDPNIWRVKCMVGREQQIVLCIMHKYADLQRLGTKMEIISAFTLEHVKGYIYIEADKACDVVEACKGFFNIYPASMGLVPGSEIPHLLSIRNKACAISKGTWVRMKNGRYKGDLGQVVDYDDVRRRATIKLVPRIDLQAIAKKYGGGVSLKEAAIPAPRLISSHELEHFRPHIEIKHDRHSGEYFEVFDGLMLKDGYLYKKVSITSFVYWGVQPSKDELLKFTEMRKAEEDDVSWLSSVYNVRKKMKSSEASDQGASEHGKGFNLHDLVLFGRKAFGVIIDIGKDGIKILKGGIEGQEVMTLKTQDIKSSCVDKMFTASDRHRKTIYINDIVKVLDGPLEGRQGIVRHMYRGTLFIYDENQEDNSGIFCAKSDLCENISSPKDSFRKAGNKSSSSFNQSPGRPFEQEDSPCTFSRNHRSESNQTFSIGQTLRIRKGPLKGYLCRVVGIYRSNVTVKLDSLVKVITVEEQFLSVPNLKRDVAAEMPSDIFGTQDRPIGGLSGSGGEQTMGASSWNAGSSSWQALSTSTFSFATSNDQKADQETGADPWGSKLAPAVTDPWGSKLAPAVKEQEQGADPWGSKVSLVAKDHEQGADPWAIKASLAAGDQGGSDPWGSKLAPGAGEEQEGADLWGSKVAGSFIDKEQQADPWGAKAALGDSSHSDKAFDSWAKAPSTSGEQNSAWNKAAGGGCEKDGDGWNRPVKTTSPSGISSSDQEQGADPWGSKVSVAEKDHKQGADPWSSKVSLATEADQGGADPWGSKLATRTREQGQGADPWASNVAGTSKDKVEKADSWGIKAGLGDSSHSDKAPGSWAKASDSGGEQNTSWNKAAGGGWEKDGDGWNQPSLKSAPVTTVGASGANAASGWETAAMGTKSAVEHGGEPSSWNKMKVSSDDQSGWDTAGWGKAGSFTKDGTNGWNNPKSFGCEQVSNWQKVDNRDSGKSQSDSWDKPSDFEGGHGFGRGRGRSRNSWDKPTDRDCGQGSGWGRGSDGNDVVCSSQGQNTGWNRQRNFDGDWGASRGRGRYGGRGTGDEDDQDRSGDFGGGWESGRGRGRGRYGGRGSRDEENQDGSGDFGGGWGSGRGRGRGRGQYGGRGSNDEDNQDFGGGWESGRGRGRGRYGGRGSRDEENQDGSGDFGGGWGSGRGRGRGRGQYGGRGSNDEDNHDSAGNFGGSWGSGRGRYGGRGNRGEDNQDSTGGFGGGWGSGRGGGRGRYGGRGTRGDDNHNSPGDFGWGGGSGNGRGSGWREQEQGTDPWASNVAGATTDREQRADPWVGKAAFADSSHSDKVFDRWAKASNTSEEQNSTWNKGAAGGCQKDGDVWNKSSVKGTPTTSGVSLSVKEGADPWGSNVSDAARDHKQGADPWGSKASLAAEGQGGADPWGSKQPAGAQEQEQGADPWGSNVTGASRDKEQKADAWGGSKSALGDSSHSNKALDSSRWKATNIGGEHNSSWNKAAGGGSDGWNKPSEKNTPVPTSENVTSGWGNADIATKSAEEHGGEPSGGWDKVQVSSDGQSGWDIAGRDKGGSSSNNGTDGWNYPKSTGGDQVSSWKKGGDEDAWRSNQRDSWDKPSNFEGGRGFGQGRGGNSWDKPMDRGRGQGSGWGGGSGWSDGSGSSQGQDNGLNRQRDSDGPQGFSRGRGRGQYGVRGGRDEENQYDGGGAWGSGRGRGRDWNGDSGSIFGRGGQGRGGGRFQSFDRD